MMKKKILIVVSMLVIGVTACGQKNKIEVGSSKISSETGEGTETKGETQEEITNLKIEKHEEDWQYLLGNSIGEIDWNANMPKVGEWAFLNYRYYPNKRVGDTPDPYFFMEQTKVVVDKDRGIEKTENVEELPELMLGDEKDWTRMGGDSSTLGAKSNQSTRAVIKTKEKRVLDGYDFMRVTGEFEVYYDETKEVDKTFKFIAYFYVSVDPGFEEDERFNTSSLENHMIYWSEGFSEERGDYASIEETADKIMSTLKLTDEQREYLKKKKG